MSDNEQFKLLIVDDELEVRNAMKRYFARSPYSLFFAEDGIAALEEISKSTVDLMLLDLKMPGMDGFDVLKAALEKQPWMKVIMLTGHGGVSEAVAAMKYGALDFFEKSISPDVLQKKVTQVYQCWHLGRENRLLQDQLSTDFRFEALIGESPPIQKLKDMIVRIGPTDTSILIQGESGTGKELIAQALHHHSLRKSEVFMPVDCAAINETVMESELFGHTKGAFTGADQATLGLIRSADKGTLFFDEVGELSMSMQVKLLRTIQERMVRPVGSTKTVPVDIRILAATNRNLADAVAEGKFRQDLYYRLNAVTLTSPPLRDRGDDILLLIKHFIENIAKEELEEKQISDDALSVLCGYNWPGNIRELENTIRGALAFARTDTITPSDLPAIIPKSDQTAMETIPDSSSLATYEEQAIRNALKQTSGNRRDAARLLNISEATLYRRIKQYDL